MGRRVNELFGNLHLKLTNIESGLDRLKSKIDANTQRAEQDVRGHLGMVQRRIEQNLAKLTTAQSEVKKWVDDRKATTSEQIALWKAKRETTKLQNRADAAERYADAAIDLAAAALDEAEQAALEAWLARRDANCAGGK
ncbi:MAG: hypothetical protein ACLQIQ_03090 [Beijerinckiaceae bacterium]